MYLNSDFLSVNLNLLKGFEQTCLIFALTLVLALPLGLVISFGSMSKFSPLRYFTKTFVWIIRGIPLMLQVLIVYYGPGLIGGEIIFERFNEIGRAHV